MRFRALAVARQPNIRLERVILIELFGGSHEFMKTMVPTIDRINALFSRRPDVWPSREAAEEDLRKQSPYKYYDKRIWDSFLVS